MTIFRKYLLLSLVVALLNAVVLLAFFVPRFTHTDSSAYSSTIEYVSGNPESEVFSNRILKPLPMFIGAALNSVLEARDTLIVQNLVFYFLSVWLLFLIIYRFYQNEKQAFYGTVLYIGAYPMLAHGLAPLTDMPGWFFYLLSVLIALNFLKKPQLKTAILSGFIASFGMLFKESVAAAPIFFISLVFIAARLPIKEKFKYILAFGVAFLFFPLVNSIFMYKLYSYSYLHWYRNVWGHSESSFYAYTPLRIVIEIGRVFLIGWVLVFWGALREFAFKNIERIKILIAFILPSLSVFLWSFPHNRILYIAAPLLVFLGSFGLLRNYKNPKINTAVELILLSLCVLVSYAMLEFFLRYGVFFPPNFNLFNPCISPYCF